MLKMLFSSVKMITYGWKKKHLVDPVHGDCQIYNTFHHTWILEGQKVDIYQDQPRGD
jgi:hypothetical protein